MLSPPERILFALAVLLSVALTARGALRIVRIIGRGQGRPDWKGVPGRLGSVLLRTVTQWHTFRLRPVTSLLHALVTWGFLYYLIVNVGDVVEGYIPDVSFPGGGWVGAAYRLMADVLSAGALVGIAGLLVRRYLVRPASLSTRASTLLHPRARRGIQRDSAIVGAFIVLHVGARMAGASFHLAASGTDPWQPFAAGLARLWAGWSEPGLTLARHAAWWVSLGLILAFLPYFPYTKHIHIFFAPINYLLKPARPSMGQLDPLDFDDPTVEQYGAARLEDLSWSALVDAYACIMCYRCQDACPAYATGKVLSPAALEINKRYFLNQEGSRLAAGEPSSQRLVDFAIPPEAVWACTACGACVEVCPVGNEPMRDILEIRRDLVLMQNAFPDQLQTAYRGMERSVNPWGVPADRRLAWAEGLGVSTAAERPQAEILWWVGCAPATEPRAQRSARALAELLQRAGVDFAVLGSEERCTGDPARRSGNEHLFHELAQENVETLNRVGPQRIVTTCPHCLHTLKNEYPAFGGRYEVVHHTQLLQELIESGRLKPKDLASDATVAFHDPCFLGRQNGVVAAPRQSLALAGIELRELPRRGTMSFCCGAGGAQMWKEEEHGQERVSANRLREARETGARTLAVGCPFCNIMLGDAARAAGGELEVLDVVEVMAARLEGSADSRLPAADRVGAGSE